MPYTWTGASALGFDLVRLPGGDRVASVLLSALAADPALVLALAATPPAPDGERTDALALVAAAQAMTVLDLREALDAGSAGLHRVRDHLLTHRFGGPADLVDLLRADGLGHLHGQVPDLLIATAVARLTDALVAAVLVAAPPQTLPRGPSRLGDALASVQAPPDPDLGPQGEEVLAILTTIRDGGRTDPLALLGSAQDRPGRWSQAMHAASWAIELSGRTRAAAAAQLRCVQALAGAGFTADDCAGGAWNQASGLVAACLVADLLPDEDHEVLTGRG